MRQTLRLLPLPDTDAAEAPEAPAPHAAPPRAEARADARSLTDAPQLGLAVARPLLAARACLTKRYRVIVAEDDALLREGLASLLERAGMEVAGVAANGPDLVRMVRQQPPDLVIVDIRVSPTDSTEALDAAHRIRAELPEVGIVLLSAHVEVELAIELLTSGERSGYLLKTNVGDVDEFVEMLKQIARRGSGVEPLVGELADAHERDDRLSELTAREREVLALMAEGRSNTGIARRLWLTTATVEKHVRSIFAKLALPASDEDNRRVLAAIACLGSR